MTNNANILANIYPCGNSLYIEVPAGYGDYIELRTGDDLLELLHGLITAGNAHFGTTARLIEASGELNVAQLLSDDETAKSATYTWQDFRCEHLA